MAKRSSLVLFVLSVLLIAFFIGCSPKVASVFFDGVPDPADSLLNNVTQKAPVVILDSSAAMKITAEVRSGPHLYIHAPYRDKHCKTCHDPSSPVKLLQDQPDLCYHCHEDFRTKYAVQHGPVSGGFCTACHSPHQSENPKQLLRTGQALCLFCHDQKQTFANAAHAVIGEADCLGCHDPHGGKNRNILKEGE